MNAAKLLCAVFGIALVIALVQVVPEKAYSSDLNGGAAVTTLDRSHDLAMGSRQKESGTTRGGGTSGTTGGGTTRGGGTSESGTMGGGATRGGGTTGGGTTGGGTSGGSSSGGSSGGGGM